MCRIYEQHKLEEVALGISSFHLFAPSLQRLHLQLPQEYSSVITGVCCCSNSHSFHSLPLLSHTWKCLELSLCGSKSLVHAALMQRGLGVGTGCSLLYFYIVFTLEAVGCCCQCSQQGVMVVGFVFNCFRGSALFFLCPHLGWHRGCQKYIQCPCGSQRCNNSSYSSRCLTCCSLPAKAATAISHTAPGLP